MEGTTLQSSRGYLTGRSPWWSQDDNKGRCTLSVFTACVIFDAREYGGV